MEAVNLSIHSRCLLPTHRVLLHSLTALFAVECEGVLLSVAFANYSPVLAKLTDLFVSCWAIASLFAIVFH